jgi:uncharacterized protein (TIGR03067 family)
MRTIATMAVLTMVLAGRMDAVSAGGESDRDKFQGAWSVSAGEKAGRKAPDGGLKGITVTFTDGRFTWKTGANESQGTFSLDETKSPREISISAEGKKHAGIYRLEGDELRICVGPGDDRPADFATRDGAESVLLILKREKP